MQYQLPASSGMTWGKRIRASLPVIIVLAAFIGFSISLLGNQPFRVYNDPDANPPAQWPATGIFWGLSQIRTSGFELSWYVKGPAPAPPSPLPGSKPVRSRR